MIIYRTPEDDTTELTATMPRNGINGSRPSQTPEASRVDTAETMTPCRDKADQDRSPTRVKRLSKPMSSDPRKFKWNRKHFALQQGKIRTSGWRFLSQGFFTVLCIVLGWQFIQFVDAAYSTTAGPLPTRPPGVEGFLPISGLMGALDWIYQGSLNTIHPAATILFLLFVALAVVFRKSFCGWICPVGLVSETLARAGRWIFGRNVKPWPWLDFILRGLKYLILGFFVWAIIGMGAEGLNAFINSPYNKVSDIKMLEFFRDLSRVGGIVILVLAAGSVVINGFWCRYMCPYGALMGLVGWLSPVKVRRDDSKCIDCKLCDKACPAKLIVSTRDTITKVECIGCHDCVSSCPAPGALKFGTKKRTVKPRTIAIAIVIALVAATSAARVAGVWQNIISDDEIRFHVARMESEEYGHPGR